MVFTDSVFNGIKVSNGSIFVSTNTALTYRFSLNLLQKSVDFIQSYTRLGSLLLDRRSLWASDDFLILGYNRLVSGKSLAFYNISSADFFQVMDVD